MSADHWIAACLVPLAVWILLSGIDDVFLDLVFAWHWLRGRWSAPARFRWPTEAELSGDSQKRIAIFVPLWREHEVIAQMLEHNIAAIRYGPYDFFVGAYPNDPDTVAAIEEVCARRPNVHLALAQHNGPTSKADCLNAVYQHMLQYERAHGTRFDVVVTHDAEDLIHPESLRLINYFAADHDMVQVPVLALRTPWHELTHGLYCDDFAEFQSKDIPVRQMLGGFLPSNGVGTGFTRNVLEKLAGAHSNRIFEPGCLTEDYENGYRIHALGCAQIFLPIHRLPGGPVATREFFPRHFRAALRQRTRWTVGIALQSWERHGWRAPARQLYWFWRDRKGLIGNLVSPLANLLFLYGLLICLPPLRKAWPGVDQVPAMAWIWYCNLALALVHLCIRIWCVCRIYGWGFALGTPVRAVWGNCLNCLATVLAIRNYFQAKLHSRPLVWLKTDHVYPAARELPRLRRLGEILVHSGRLSSADLQLALVCQPKGVRFGEFLLRSGRVSEPQLYEALSTQQGLPLGVPACHLAPAVTRSLPARVAREWKVLPFRVAGGRLHVAGPELPTQEQARALRKFCSLKIRHHLVTPSEFEQLAEQYLA